MKNHFTTKLILHVYDSFFLNINVNESKGTHSHACDAQREHSMSSLCIKSKETIACHQFLLLLPKKKSFFFIFIKCVFAFPCVPFLGHSCWRCRRRRCRYIFFYFRFLLHHLHFYTFLMVFIQHFDFAFRIHFTVVWIIFAQFEQIYIYGVCACICVRACACLLWRHSQNITLL